ncbi:hypothetical protein LXL04_020939 [Taraxacum kok-saghyz]
METKVLVIGEVLPCMLMVLMEVCTIGLTILASTVLSKGLSPFVFVVYTNALSSIFLLPYNTFIIRRNKFGSFFSHDPERRPYPAVSSPRFRRGDNGTKSSVCWIELQLPNRCLWNGQFNSVYFLHSCRSLQVHFHFVLKKKGYHDMLDSELVALDAPWKDNSTPIIDILYVYRKTSVDLRSSSTRVKLVGTLISIIGAVSLVLYRGPVIKESSAHLQMAPRLFVFLSKDEHWTTGCLLFASASLAFSIWNILQVGTLEKCPEVMTVASSYSLFGTVQSALLALIIERDPNAWRLQFDMGLLVIFSTAVFASLIKSHVHMWCIQRKGHFYVTMFRPLGVPIASTFGCIFFASTFHYGSMMSAALTGMGYYIMMWGQMREDESKRGKVDLLEEKTPLLEAEDQV